MYTTSSVFLAALSRAGVTHAFVNWGSDHPAMLEELERQRRAYAGNTAPIIVTCPNEMVALSAAHGYAQVTGKPAAVLVHVDVGTQSLGGAVHNADRGRVPVLIYAGASPYTSDGELKGSRNEWIMWLQDVPDQSAIVRQYMRWTAQINTGKNVAQLVMRGLQIATSQPQGPIYLWARREVMEEDVEESLVDQMPDPKHWPAVSPAALCPQNLSVISEALRNARAPLILVSRMRPHGKTFQLLHTLATRLSIAVLVSCPSTVCIPFSHPSYQGTSFGKKTSSDALEDADVVLVLDVDIPWIPTTGSHPKKDARVFVLDAGDPLKLGFGFAHTDAEIIASADAEVALGQLLDVLSSEPLNGATGRVDREPVALRAEALQTRHTEWVKVLDESEAMLPSDGSFTVPNIIGILRAAIAEGTPSRGEKTLVLNETISNYPLVWDHLRAERAGAVISSGTSSLGWALGAAVGASMGAAVAQLACELVVVVVGDGSFLFGAPSSAYWMARKYGTPFLTIVLNNGGWKSPKLSMLGVYPTGLGSTVPGADLTVGFGPHPPDYSQIAVAAGGAWGRKIDRAVELAQTLKEAVDVVVKERRCAVVDCVLESI